MMKRQEQQGFTLIESIAALAVAAIALLALLRLQLVSIGTADKAQLTTQAVLLAQAKIAETIGAEYPPTGAKSGVAEVDGTEFGWQTAVTDERVSFSQRSASLGGRLRKLSVDVSWQQGPGAKSVSFTTYVAENRIREE